MDIAVDIAAGLIGTLAVGPDRHGGEFISEELQSYCLQTGMSLEYANTNTKQ